VPPYGLPLIRRIIQVRRRFPGFSKDGCLGSKHPLPGGVILKEVRGIARDQEGGIWLFDLNQGLFPLADGMLTRIANALELEPNYRVLLRRYLGRAMVFHRGGFGRTCMSTPVASGLAVRAVRASFDNDRSVRSPNPTDFPLSPSSAWPKTTTVTGGLPPILEF
jgi:hypothetical protein